MQAVKGQAPGTVFLAYAVQGKELGPAGLAFLNPSRGLPLPAWPMPPLSGSTGADPVPEAKDHVADGCRGTWHKLGPSLISFGVSICWIWASLYNEGSHHVSTPWIHQALHKGQKSRVGVETARLPF